MSEFFFRTSDLSVGYNGKTLIRDIEIRVRAGEILTLIGPNGSGKSTILKSITKHLTAIKGDSFIADASVNAMSYKELSKKLAVVLTERIKGELLTCWDVVSTGRYPYTSTLGLLSPEDREKVQAAMVRVHADELADKDFTAISDGQRQRVLLARAICQEPEIIVLDEPTSYLDIRHKLELLEILRSMAREKGITVIMSLHEIDLAQKISDRIMCVKGDVIAHFGTPEDIFREDVISELYGLPRGAYDIRFGSVELPKPKGEPRVFVLCGGGSGAAVFRRLQREDTPFYAGVLQENDMDYPIALNLASEVYSDPPFMPLRESTCDRALAAMDTCDTVICTDFPIGEANRAVEKLIRAAEERGVLKRIGGGASFD